MSACGGNNPQLWPPTDVDLTSSSLKDELWDDSEVVAQYDRIDAFVKKKLTTIYQERTGKLRPGRTNPVKSSPSNRRRSSSRKNLHVRTPSSSPRSSARRNGSSSVPSVSKLLVNGPEADFTPTYATTIPPCDYQWLPPILYPPDVLFNRRLTE